MNEALHKINERPALQCKTDLFLYNVFCNSILFINLTGYYYKVDLAAHFISTVFFFPFFCTQPAFYLGGCALSASGLLDHVVTNHSCSVPVNIQANMYAHLTDRSSTTLVTFISSERVIKPKTNKLRRLRIGALGTMPVVQQLSS